MRKNSKRLLVIAISSALAAPMAAFATNGMNMDGYGPVATGMGGASMAYDNGTAAMMNNPATIGLADDGSRLDLALGELSPSVKSSMGTSSWTSSSNAFYMPAVGWTTKSDGLAYGVGAFAQGGMGTEYSPGVGAQMTAGMIAGSGASLYTAQTAFGNPGVTASAAMQSTVAGLKERSEVGVMRLLVPVSYNVNNALTVGGSIDFVRATMDLQMAMPGYTMGQMIASGDISGTMVTGLSNAMTAGMVKDVYYGYFDFTDNSAFSGKAQGNGFAGKLGLTYRVNSKLTIGATYHSETSLGDLEASGAKVSMGMNADVGYFTTGTPSGVFADMSPTLTGKIKVKNFQWPATFGVGLAYQATDNLRVVADYKSINWSAVMKDFKMSFTADSSASNGGFANTTMDATMAQNWKDQGVIEIGAAYNVNPDLTLRAGINHASNPVPNSTVNYLFPATVESHYSVGVGYKMGAASEVNFSYTMVPEVKVTGNGSANNGLSVSHSQSNWQLMYSRHF